ncbi:MAG: translation elongation factor 4 [Planctomycetota bacterium]
MTDLKKTRNFCIIAHIDHGKSTLADRILLKAGSVTPREFQNQFLDDMDLERERGITIKARAVCMTMNVRGEDYTFNLIDTPGHVDFNYEVSRSLSACEGALLLVDATQGIQAQTVANTYLALELGMELIPVLNKIDLPTSRIEQVTQELNDAFGFKPDEILKASGKTGEGLDGVVEAVVDRIPAPSGDLAKPSRAMIFDSQFDDYKGVLVYIRVLDGAFEVGQPLEFLSTEGKNYEITEVGIFAPKMKKIQRLEAGQVGYVCANIRALDDVKVGDTVVNSREAGVTPFPGFKQPQPMVFCGLYPVEGDEYKLLGVALEKLHLNDASFTFAQESSVALGFGFRCGFLGLLHMEIIQERLEREFNINLVKTSPNVSYMVLEVDGKETLIDNPSHLPDLSRIEELKEPIVKLQLLVPQSSIGSLMTLLNERRGIYKKTDYLGAERVILYYELPLAEIIYDFYDKLKSVTRGYGTMDYEFLEYRKADLVRMDILVNNNPVDALSTILHRANSYHRGRKIIERLKESIPKHLFEIPLQAAIGAKIIARETIRATAKNVTAKCYGGDVSRKKKLLEKQKKGKKRMKQVGSVEIPQEAFLSVLGGDD